MGHKPIVAVIGVGLMGGSLGMALRKRKAARVIGVGRSAAKLARARRAGACDAVSTNLSSVRDAEIVVLCAGVNELVPLYWRIQPHLQSGAVVTDIGSVKSPILKGVGVATHFVGSHPMTGAEKTGVENARADLYENATVVVCSSKETSARAVKAVKALWRSVGARTLDMAPDVHDLLVSETSHLPHALASVLVRQVGTLNRRDSATAKILAGSFRDMTRIADSDPAQWAEICAANHKYLVGAIKSYRDILSKLLSSVENASDRKAAWENHFSAARRSRALLLSKSPKFNIQ